VTTPKPENPYGDVYEYRLHYVHFPLPDQEINDLNALGREAWQAIDRAVVAGFPVYVLMRRLPAPEATPR
jgi:hypothetical protein